ncbi:Prephenate dehydratase [Parvibaculum lavamentivorans DS-1]|uniref:Prephenate dehydratase n=1 Tax=Parvibaculum lavamentivorans (strain DS-1 / DSM 13023 / NCIMB 13966) TaxID=402881 RepID=A7HPS6_PARL1|nr:transporter substrate-binding domain-containing protein [Parvibaculum lavamentivorans]ABS61909.1 Prephenate dehydratase [Parvibaculum lavamentivorans DS-1]
MRHLPRLLALSALALLLGLVPAAADTLARIEAAGTLRVGLTGDYKPFSWEAPQGHFEGLDVDMARALADSLGLRLEIVPTSWPGLMDDLAAEKFDIGMGGISVTEERRTTAFFSTPLLTDGKTPIARCEDAARFQTLDQIDREGVTLIVNPGGTNEKFTRANIKTAAIILHKDNATIFEEIAEGRADLMITDAIETRIMAKEHPALCAIHPDEPFDRSEKAYLLPQDEAWKARVDEWLAAMEASGEKATIFGKWVE